MKKLLVVLAIILGFYFLFSTYYRISPSYFIKIVEREYSFDEFFQNNLSREQYTKLDKSQKFTRIYEQLKVFLCVPDCKVTVFSFDTAPVDIAVEGMFYRHTDALTDEKIRKGREELASEQYFFSILDRTLLIINDRDLQIKTQPSVLPWIGRTQDSFLVEFMYADNFNEWFRPWMIRFIRDYRKFVKIYMLPFEEGVDFMEQVATAVCLKEKKIFWDLYFSEKLDLQDQACEPSIEIPPMEKHDLAIRLGENTLKSPLSYGEMAKAFQISYLSQKVKY